MSPESGVGRGPAVTEKGAEAAALVGVSCIGLALIAIVLAVAGSGILK